MKTRNRRLAYAQLEWDDGTRAKVKGKDLASVAARLSDAELEFWLSRFAAIPLPLELAILEAEGGRRWGADWKNGPLFREQR